MAVTSLIRMYAVKHKVADQNTLKRIDILHNKLIISTEQYNELIQIYNSLMMLRIRNQVQQINRNQEVNNYISPKELTEIERTTLKKIFAQISDFQSKLKLEFGGKF